MENKKMNFQLIKSPLNEVFRTLLSNTKRELIIASPFVNESGVDFFLKSVSNRSKVKVNLLTNLSVKNIVEDITQPTALLKLYGGFKEISISNLARLHAKVYIVDETRAMISSANLTHGGIKGNFEYGVIIDDSSTAKSIKHDVLEYAALGSSIDKVLLEKINAENKKIEKIKKDQTKKFKNSELSKLLAQTEKVIDTNLLENRIKEGRTINEIFSNTIMYLLSKHEQLTTMELNELIHEIHPDICNDSIDRVINGQHFGKLWKHSVRNAQQHLKNKNLITSVDRKWQLTE